MSDVLQQIQNAVLEGNEGVSASLVSAAMTRGLTAETVLNQGLVPGMDQVAILFRDGDMFIPEVLMSAKAMQAGNDVLKPHLAAGSSEKKGKIVIGTVEGDLHDIGKKIVGMMLEGAGFEVIDLGMDVSAERFIGALRETQADLIGMSAMLTTTMPVMAAVIAQMEKEGFKDRVKIMVGGAPVSEFYAKRVGANYSYDAASAVELANELIGE